MKKKSEIHHDEYAECMASHGTYDQTGRIGRCAIFLWVFFREHDGSIRQGKEYQLCTENWKKSVRWNRQRIKFISDWKKDTVDRLVVCADFYHAYNKRSAAINMSNKTKSTVETEKIGFLKMCQCWYSRNKCVYSK